MGKSTAISILGNEEKLLNSPHTESQTARIKHFRAELRNLLGLHWRSLTGYPRYSYFVYSSY